MIQLRKFLGVLEMIQPKIRFASDSRNRRRSGMTLIELLVAISILVIIAAILVPQLRFASADRNIREASRIVASLFASASQRAINDGEAGVVIERNPNIVEGGVAYAGTSLFMLRSVPRYIGEDDTDIAELVRMTDAEFPDDPGRISGSVFIPLPLEQQELGIVRVGDQISFNDQTNVRFIIVSVAPQADVDGVLKLRLGLESATGFNDDTVVVLEPTEINGRSRLIIGEGRFIIYRQPRKLVSSRVDLPSGYLIDLRLSGEISNLGIAFFDLDQRNAADNGGAITEAIPNSVTYLFNGRGSIDRFFYSVSSADGPGTRLFGLPRQSAYLMVREYSTDDGGEAVGNVLNNEGNMWVTVDPVTGTANVVPSVPANLADFASNQDAVREARKLGSRGQAAQ